MIIISDKVVQFRMKYMPIKNVFEAMTQEMQYVWNVCKEVCTQIILENVNKNKSELQYIS